MGCTEFDSGTASLGSKRHNDHLVLSAMGALWWAAMPGPWLLYSTGDDVAPEKVHGAGVGSDPTRVLEP